MMNDETLTATLMNNTLFRSNFKVVHIYSVHKNSQNSQFTTLKYFLYISVKGFQINSY